MVQYRFTLTYNAVDTILTPEEEPKNFSSIQSVIKRDFATHGTFYQFTDGALRLEFPGTGKTVLKDAFDADGVDAVVTLLVERRASEYDSYVSVFEGQANFIDYEINQDYFVIDFEEISLQTKIMARKEVEYSTEKTTDLEGNAIAPDYSSFNYNSLSFYERSSLQAFFPAGGIQLITIQEGAPVTFLNDGETNGFESVLDEITFIDGDKANIEASYSSSYSVDIETFNDGTTSVDGWSTGAGFEFKADKGVREYSVDVDFTIEGALRVGAASGSIFFTTFVYDVIRGNEVLVEVDIQTVGLTGSGQDFSFTKSLDISKTTKRIYLGIGTTVSTGSDDVAVNILDGITIETSWRSQYQDTLVNGNLIHEALDHNLQYITGEANLLHSDFFGRTGLGYDVDGCGGFFMETNGNNIRANRKGIIGSLKKRLDSLNAIFNIGHGIQFDDYDKSAYRYRVEQAEYFYQDAELASFDNIEKQSYSESYFKDMAFNQVLVGFSEFAKEDELPGSKLDFLTEGSWSLPIDALVQGDDGNSSSSIYRIVSDYIASPYLWERTRRVQFSEEPTKTTKYDDDLFIVQLEDAYPNFKQLDDDSIIVSNSGNFGDQPNYVRESYFNFLIRPIYNLINHGFLIAPALFGKLGSSLVRNSNYKVNDSFTYRRNFLSCLGRSGDFDVDGDIQKFELENGLQLFDPVLIKFKASMDREQAQEIKLGHQNGLSEKNYGYISVTDPDGNTKQGWVMELKYNPVDQIGDFQLLKKA